MSDLIRSMSRRYALPKPPPRPNDRTPFMNVPFSGSIKRQHLPMPEVENVPPVPGMKKRGIKDNEI
jgi:hypothetical protein